MPSLKRLHAAGLGLAGLLLGAAPGAAELAGHGGFVKGVAVSPDGRRIMTASFDYTLILWDLAA
ncbi:MAG: WD40 domain-containing protein, partial [Rhodospirillales bacterium]|nr:WD40 domain-containing protein [Rhodospirillales bacterium]